MPSIEELIGNPSESLVAESVYACTRLQEEEARWPLVVSEVCDLHASEHSISEEEADRLVREAVQRGEVYIALNDAMEWCLSIDSESERRIHRRYWYWKLKGAGIEVFPLYNWPYAIDSVRLVVSEWMDNHGNGPTYRELHDEVDALFGDEDGAIQAVHKAIETGAIERIGDEFVLGSSIPFSWGEE